MPFSLVGWSESQDSAVLVNVAALADPHIRVFGDDVLIPDFASQLVALYALGPNTTRAQLQSPSLRRMVNLEVTPIDVAALPTTRPPVAQFLDSPLPLIPDESVNALAAEDAAGAARSTLLAWLADGPLSPITGEIYTVRVTNATTLVANAWTNGGLTFDQTLQPGEYAIVGAMFRSTNLQAFRFVVPGVAHRPGGVGHAAISAITLPGQRRGGWGEWLRFRHTVPPTVDFLANGADASQVGELDLVKVG